jgi:small subunit ribosomal protein S5
MENKKVKAGEIELTEKVVSINRVAKVVKGGRRFSFSAIVVVGNGDGVVGYGLGKANEITDAITKGIDEAKKNIFKVPVLNGTVPHEIKGKYSGGKVLLKPASPGTGVIAGPAVRAIMDALGVQDVLTKCLGSNNPHNVVRSTFVGLQSMESVEQYAERTGKDLEEAYGNYTVHLTAAVR